MRTSSYPPQFSLANGQSYTAATKERNLNVPIQQDNMTNIAEWLIEVKDFDTRRASHYMIRCVNDADSSREIIWLPVSIEFCEDHLFI